MARRGRKKHGRKRSSTFGKVKGAVYLGSLVGPAAVAFGQMGGMSDPLNAAGRTLQAMGGINKAGSFEFAVLKQMYTPVVAVAAVDIVSSKLGIQRRIGQGISRLMR